MPYYRGRTGWLGRLDSNQGMAESKSAALPLGYAPTRARYTGHPAGKQIRPVCGAPRLGTAPQPRDSIGPLMPCWGAHMPIRLCLLLALLAVSAPAFGQPATKPLQMIVPFAPGGSADGIARLIATELVAKSNRQVVVENKPGAGGTLGLVLAAKAPPDGSTLAVAATGASGARAEVRRRRPGAGMRAARARQHRPSPDRAPACGAGRARCRPAVRRGSRAGALASPPSDVAPRRVTVPLRRLPEPFP